MYKVIFLLRYRKDLSPEYVRKEWLGSHGSIAMKLPKLGGYVQNHWTGAATGHEQVYDGSVELYFDNAADFEAAFASSVGQEMLKDDLRLFDRSAVPAYVGGVVEEHVMFWKPGSTDRIREGTL
jgi:uncharacterized protein (TIGR02118 family)